MNQQLSWRSIIGYGLGDVANNFAFAMGAMFLLSYYTDVAGIGAATAGTMLLVVRVFDAFADVAAGRIIDKTHTRWGKFRPFILFGSAPLMFFSVLVFSVPTEWAHSDKVIYAYVTYMALGVCYSLINIPYGSLATAMTLQPLSRARLGAARSIGGAVTGIFLTLLITPFVSSAGANIASIEMEKVYFYVTLGLAFFGVGLYFVCFKSTKEIIVRTDVQPSLKNSLNTIKQNKALMILCSATICVLISGFTVSASSLFYVRYVLNDVTLFPIISLVQGIFGAITSALIMPILVARFGKKNTFLIGGMIAILGYLTFYYLSIYPPMIALTSYTIASIGMGIVVTVLWAIEADTVEYGEYKTGIRIEGLTYSLFSFTRKCGQAIGGSIPAFILEYSGYIANQIQTPDVIFGIRMSIALVPCIFMLLAFVIICFYPLTDKKHAEIVAEIELRKKEKLEQVETVKSESLTT
ncbi:glucuronide transporter [Providencia stuartii]|uniref:glucuronide transporter n=1 Tax=Providencia stuartii TaxID=588 RepID=UPI002AA0C0E6|nr:glucuronide transporter [Providencia stuartii]